MISSVVLFWDVCCQAQVQVHFQSIQIQSIYSIQSYLETKDLDQEQHLKFGLPPPTF